MNNNFTKFYAFTLVCFKVFRKKLCVLTTKLLRETSKKKDNDLVRCLLHYISKPKYYPQNKNHVSAKTIIVSDKPTREYLLTFVLLIIDKLKTRKNVKQNRISNRR